MQTKSYTVPLPLWESLDSIFQKKAKELIKDIAKACKQPEKSLLDAFKAQKHTVNLLELTDPTEEKFECEALLNHSHIHTRCRKTVLYGKKYCPEHEFYQQAVCLEKPILHRCITEENEIVFINKSTNTIYDVNYKPIGLYVAKRVILFEIQDEIEYT